jgi:outer membrane protein W
MKGVRIIIFFFAQGLFLISLKSTSQIINCSDNYEKALKFYNSGMVDSALNVIKPCLGNTKALDGVTNGTRVNIYRLAALSEIMKGDPDKAEVYVKQLLKYKPDYKTSFREDDLMEFRQMLDKSYSQPSLRLGIIGGFGISFVKLQKKYSNYETASGAKYSLHTSPGYQFGIAGEKTFTKNISLEVAAEITRVQFKYISINLASTQYQYNQSLTCMEIPVLAKYYFSIKSPFKPYLQGGVSGRISLNNMENSDAYGRYWFTKSSNSDKILTTFLTDFEYFGLILGGGVGYDLKKLNIRLDVRYNHYFKNSGLYSKFDAIAGYEDIPDTERFHFTDDINLISMKNIQISIGLFYNLNYKVF